MFLMRLTPLDGPALQAELTDPAAGACVTFEGWVRNENEGKEVHRLEYEGYEAMAVKEGAKITAEARDKFGILHATCVHRVGHLDIGEMAVWVGVTSGHRTEAFRACEYIIDEIKHRLPIWKKEYYTDGDSGWVNCEACASHAHPHP